MEKVLGVLVGDGPESASGGMRPRRPPDRNPPQADCETEPHMLLAMASHDLNGPLTSISAHVEMLRADYAATLNEGFARDLAAIERGLGRMMRLTRDLVDHARAEHAVEPVRVSLAELVAETITDLGATSVVSVAGPLPDVLADPGLLRRVLDNLFGNAIKYTRPGETPEIKINASARTDGTVLLEIADRGVGIADGDRTRVFEAFRRCAGADGYPGTGLGLTICRRIIEGHGGRIGVEENPGGGSVFWFTLTAAEVSTAQRAAR